MSMTKNRVLAMCAGCLGATASATGKLGMDGSHVTKFCENVAYAIGDFSTGDEMYLANYAAVTIRLCLIGVTILLNAAMWGLFMESMQGLNSGEAVVLNTGSNILVSAFLGQVVFGETFGTLWWIGASLILCGMAILQSRTETSGKPTKKKQEHLD